MTEAAAPSPAMAREAPLLADRVALIEARRQDVTCDAATALIECGVPAGHLRAWSAGWSHPDLDCHVVLLVRLEQFWHTMTQPGTDRATVEVMRRLTVPDAVAWLCAYRATRTDTYYATCADLTGYADLPYGWVYVAAGLTPHEAAVVPVEHVRAMVALRSITLPPLDVP